MVKYNFCTSTTLPRTCSNLQYTSSSPQTVVAKTCVQNIGVNNISNKTHEKNDVTSQATTVKHKQTVNQSTTDQPKSFHLGTSWFTNARFKCFNVQCSASSKPEQPPPLCKVVKKKLLYKHTLSCEVKTYLHTTFSTNLQSCLVPT